MALVRGNGGLDIRFCVRYPEKNTSLSGTACFGIFCVKSRLWPLAVASCKHTKKNLTRFWCTKSRMRRNEMPGRIVTNCCTGVWVHDVITCADLYYDRLRGLGAAGGQIFGFLHWLASSPLQQSRNTVRVCDYGLAVLVRLNINHMFWSPIVDTNHFSWILFCTPHLKIKLMSMA